MSWYNQNSNTWLEPTLWSWSAGFLVVKPAQLQQSRFWCSKARCNGSVPLPTLTRNRSSGLEQLQTLVKRKKCWYDEKRRHNASFYPVDDSRISDGHTTHTSNSMDGWELRTATGRWQACRGVADWLPLTTFIIAISHPAFTFQYSYGLTPAWSWYRTTNQLMAIYVVLLLPQCHSQREMSQQLIPTWSTLNTALYGWIWMMQW